MGDFELDTRIERIADEPARFRTEILDDWRIWGPAGGYVATILLRAAGAVAEIQRPVAFGCHFFRFASFEPAEISVEIMHRSRRAESLRVSLTQNDKAIAEAWVRTAEVGPGFEHDVGKAPEIPPPEQLESIKEHNTPMPFWDNLEARSPWGNRFTGERQAHPPEWKEWFRFRPRATFEDIWVDAGRALLLVDVFSWPAAAQPHLNREDYFAPNLEVAAWFHRSEAKSEWLLTDTECLVAEDGLMGTTCRIWSQSGKLLVSGGAQLLCTPRQKS